MTPAAELAELAVVRACAGDTAGARAALGRLADLVNAARLEVELRPPQRQLEAQAEHFGAWVRRERRRRGWTVKELAQASGLSSESLYQLEASATRSSRIRESTRRRLEDALRREVAA